MLILQYIMRNNDAGSYTKFVSLIRTIIPGEGLILRRYFCCRCVSILTSYLGLLERGAS